MDPADRYNFITVESFSIGRGREKSRGIKISPDYGWSLFLLNVINSSSLHFRLKGNVPHGC